MAASFSLTGTLRLTPVWTEPLDLVDVVDRTVISEAITLVDGDGAGEADCYWKDVRTVAPASADTLDLSALPLDVYGGTATLDMATVRLIYIKNRSATIPIRYDIDGNDGRVSIAPGGVFLWHAGSAVSYVPTNLAAEIYLYNPGASAADYEIVIAGVKA